jgi:MFS family permease
VTKRLERFSGLSADTFLLALASLFADTASEMLYPVLPIFLTQTLGASAGIVGVVEGIAQAAQNVVQALSGWISDRLQRHKRVALAGYALGALAKPLIGLATGWAGVLSARTLERLGSGVRSAPRDALVAASADPAHRGRAFGLESLGDNFGAFIGPLLAIALLGAFELELRTIFLIALAPGALAALMVAFVREQPAPSPQRKHDLSFRRLPSGYWRYLAATALFGIGNSSNSFLILRTRGLGASLGATISVYALFNLVAALVSYPAGQLSDKLGKKRVLLLGLVVFSAVYAGFAVTSNVVLIGSLFALYGVHQGIFRAVGKALAADFSPAELRASGVGGYTATLGLSGLIASTVGGQLWMRLGPPATFFFGAVCAAAGGIALALLVPARGSD